MRNTADDHSEIRAAISFTAEFDMFVEYVRQGHATRRYAKEHATYLDDEVDGILRLLESDWVGPMNIGNPDEYSILELAQACLEVTGSSSELVYEPLPGDDPKVRRPDITLARDVLGWAPQVSLREGLEHTAAWYRAELLTAGATPAPLRWR